MCRATDALRVLCSSGTAAGHVIGRGVVDEGVLFSQGVDVPNVVGGGGKRGGDGHTEEGKLAHGPEREPLGWGVELRRSGAECKARSEWV